MLNVALFVLTSLGIVHLGSVCSMPVRVIRYFEIWRVFTPAWFHAGVLHIAMNMSTFVGMGPGLERQWGCFYSVAADGVCNCRYCHGLALV